MLRPSDGAEDLVQQVFQEAIANWHRLDALDEEGRRRWLFTVLRRRAIDQWRREQQATRDLELLDAPGLGPADDLSDLVVSDVNLGELWRDLQSMPRRQYQVAYLAFHEDWDVQRIADELSMAPSTVRVHKHKAAQFIRRAIENLGDGGKLRWER